MKRTLPWALVAIFPLTSLLAVTALENWSWETLSQHAATSSMAAFVIQYWWGILFVAIVVQIAWFLITMLRNQHLPRWLRAVWSVAIVLLGPIATPAYWWVHSDRG